MRYTFEVYAGWVKHNLWTLTPRVAREWRGSAVNKDRWWPYFEAIIKAVDQIHHEPVLTRVWRQGELVANRSIPEYGKLKVATMLGGNCFWVKESDQSVREVVRRDS